MCYAVLISFWKGLQDSKLHDPHSQKCQVAFPSDIFWKKSVTISSRTSMFPKTPSLTGLGISVKYVFKYIHVMLNFLRNERHYVKTAGLIAKRSQFFFDKAIMDPNCCLSWRPRATMFTHVASNPMCTYIDVRTNPNFCSSSLNVLIWTRTPSFTRLRRQWLFTFQLRLGMMPLTLHTHLHPTLLPTLHPNLPVPHAPIPLLPESQEQYRTYP